MTVAAMTLVAMTLVAMTVAVPLLTYRVVATGRGVAGRADGGAVIGRLGGVDHVHHGHAEVDPQGVHHEEAVAGHQRQAVARRAARRRWGSTRLINPPLKPLELELELELALTPELARELALELDIELELELELALELELELSLELSWFVVSVVVSLSQTAPHPDCP